MAKMIRFYLSAVLALTALLITPLPAQTAPGKDDQQLLELVKDVRAQQAQIADNQTKIDAKLADLTEAIRVARLFAGKAGK